MLVQNKKEHCIRLHHTILSRIISLWKSLSGQNMDPVLGLETSVMLSCIVWLIHHTVYTVWAISIHEEYNMNSVFRIGCNRYRFMTCFERAQKRGHYRNKPILRILHNSTQVYQHWSNYKLSNSKWGNHL